MYSMELTREQNYEIIRKIMESEGGMSEVLKMCLEILMKSERALHNEMYSDLSNGFRPRKLATHGKILELKVPRTRFNSFYPVILAILKEEEEEYKKLAFQLYSAGLTTDQIGDIFETVYGKNYSTSQVSRMFNHARDEVEEWRNRPLDNYYPICYIDATYVPTRRVDSVSKEAYFTVLGVKKDRTREVLGVYNNPTEGASIWEDIFEDIESRGVNEIGLIVSDGLRGIENTIHKHYPGTDVQLCTVHLIRESLKYAKTKHKKEMASDLKEVFQTNDSSDTQERGIQRWEEFCNKWGKYYSNFKSKAKNDRYRLYFTYLNYDYRIRSMIKSTNWIERLNRDYKRTTRMRGALPNPEAALLLLGSVAMTRKAYSRVVPNIGYERDKFRWDEKY